MFALISSPIYLKQDFKQPQIKQPTPFSLWHSKCSGFGLSRGLIFGSGGCGRHASTERSGEESLKLPASHGNPIPSAETVAMVPPEQLLILVTILANWAMMERKLGKEAQGKEMRVAPRNSTVFFFRPTLHLREAVVAKSMACCHEGKSQNHKIS